MSNIVKYICNPIGINSLEEYKNLKGRFSNNVCEVYFFRGIGYSKDLISSLTVLDKYFSEEMQKGNLKYIRISSLGNLTIGADLDYYSSMCERWSGTGELRFRNILCSNEMELIIKEAYGKVVEKYKQCKAGVSETMIKNFATKLLYWIDNTVSMCLDNWSMGNNIKIIADNVIKEQEYLFYYMLTLLGMDVLLLQTEGDIKAESLKGLSGVFNIGDFSSEKIPEYKECVKKETRTVKKPKERQIPVVSVAGSEKKAEVKERARTGSTSKTGETTSRSRARKELSSEELAKLASSIVMIGIHDKDGQIIGSGSGIMIGKDGYILTNNHVAAGGYFYSVRIEEEEKVYRTDEIIKYNGNLDMAIIRIDRKLKPLKIYNGREKLVRGQKVVAIGSPLGLFNSVSDGIISGFRRINDMDMIQFTAPISHGSSGGAVINMYGEVIGMSTAGLDDGQNINLAVGYEDLLNFAKGFC